MRVVLSVMLAMAAGSGSVSVLAQQGSLAEGSVMEAVERLRPGEYLWAPEVAPAGPLLMVVNLSTQRVILYRNGVPIGISTASTGRKGYTTPTGVFTVLQKKVRHFSSTYDNAPMPYMQRLTWRGIALHAGNLPGYPASHGCIRLPMEFAQRIYAETQMGMTVVITRAPGGAPRITPAVDLLPGTQPLSPRLAGDVLPGGYEWTPDKAPPGPVSIIVSGNDRRVVVLRNGVRIGSAPVETAAPILQTAAYSLQSEEGQGANWIRLPLPGQLTLPPSDGSEWRQLRMSDEFRARIDAIVHPGATLVVTRDSLKRSSTGHSVTVITDE